jgi:hypothetical protein
MDDRNNKKIFLRKYVGREVVIKIGSNIEIMGRMREPNFEGGYVEFSPYVSHCADQENVYLNEDPESPLAKSLCLFDKSVLWGIESKPDGFLKEKTDAINRNNKRNYMGFGK